MKKILIFYTSIGLGHKSIAENIGDALQRAGFEVVLEDILQVQKGKLADMGTWLHHLVNTKAPWFWSWLYKSTDHGLLSFFTLPLRVTLASRNHQKTLELINRDNPDLVLCVQTTASAIVSYLKKKGFYKKIFVISFSDFHLHRYWLYDNCDYYLANIEEQKENMIKLGVGEEKIAVCGITLKPKKQIDTNEVKMRLGIKPAEKIILVGMGSLGIGLKQETLEQLMSIDNAKLIIVCGKNQKLYEKLNADYRNNLNLKVFGFYSPMEELYAVADIFITKPGGLTTTEALRYNLPLIVTHWLPGQEELNINYLTKRSLIVAKPAKLVELVREEIETGKLRGLLKNSMPKHELVKDGALVVDKVKSLLHENGNT